jgi:hypothetical protein
MDINDRKEEDAGECCVIRSFIVCILHKILTRLLNKGGGDYRYMQKAGET